MLLRSARYSTRLELPCLCRIPSFCCRPYTTAPSLFSNSTRPFAKPRATQHVGLPDLQSSQRRGAKRTSTVTLDDMHQGPIKAEALPPQDDAEPEYPPLLQQVRNNMLKFSHCVVITRVGGFYEVLV